MLSTPLFRQNDLVHARDDLRVAEMYYNIHNGCGVILNKQRLYAIRTDDAVALDLEDWHNDPAAYSVEGWFVADDMFVEGSRIWSVIIL